MRYISFIIYIFTKLGVSYYNVMTVTANEVGLNLSNNFDLETNWHCEKCDEIRKKNTPGLQAKALNRGFAQ